MDMYGFWRSQATYRVRVSLNLKGIDYREIPINIDAGGQNDPAFRAMNPMGGVPALMAGDTPLIQSLSILEYLEETHPEPALLPADALGRARVRSLAAMAAIDSHPLIVPRVKRYLMDKGGFDDAQWRAWLTHWIGAGLSGIETRLARDTATGRFCHGDSVTIADICVVGLAASAKTFKLDVPATPTLDRIFAECQAMPAFERAKASNQSDYPG